ncbi:MAG: hypothetical protein M3R35_04990 [Candidatus Eremiobacteraeota bacterium]|nr:hypothetical protein [Candidatus Eremiobacteraeota bacterium]
MPTLSLTALAAYDGAWKRAILALKHGRRDVAGTLGERLATFVRSDRLLVGVPTTRARRGDRGFDGAVLLAQRAAMHAGARCAAVLHQRAGDTQRGRNRTARLQARGRFGCSPPAVSGTEAVLIDDVATTGATLEDCAATMRESGWVVAHAIVVARARPSIASIKKE